MRGLVLCERLNCSAMSLPLRHWLGRRIGGGPEASVVATDSVCDEACWLSRPGEEGLCGEASAGLENSRWTVRLLTSIPEEAADSGRREAFNIMLSMPRGTDPLAVQRAAREFARVELAGHKYVMVLHDHQANPHVHVSVRAEARDGRRLNPRKADLHRWRETFAEKLRELGVEAEASRQAVRGSHRRPEVLWRVKARAEGRANSQRVEGPAPAGPLGGRSAVWRTWRLMALALASSGDRSDERLASAIERFVDARGQVGLTVEKMRPTAQRSVEPPRR